LLEMEIDVMQMLSTFFGWFIVIVVIALVFGVIMMILRLYFFATILGGFNPGSGRRGSLRNTQCQYCGKFTPPDSAFCKNCGARIR